MTDNAGLKGAAQIAAEQVASTKNVRIKPDIVERLRNATWGARAEWAENVLEAADEIERLRSQLYHATVAVDGIREHALEEAAQEVGRWSSPARTERIAAAIRELKETNDRR
jgi:hypothetical protein